MEKSLDAIEETDGKVSSKLYKGGSSKGGSSKTKSVQNASHTIRFLGTLVDVTVAVRIMNKYRKEEITKEEAGTQFATLLFSKIAGKLGGAILGPAGSATGMALATFLGDSRGEITEEAATQFIFSLYGMLAGGPLGAALFPINPVLGGVVGSVVGNALGGMFGAWFM